MRLFQTHLGLSWTRYDVISVSAARLLVAAVAKFTAIHEENHPRMVYLKRMRGRDPLKKLKKSSKSENKMGSNPSILFCGCILFFEGPNP